MKMYMSKPQQQIVVLGRTGKICLIEKTKIENIFKLLSCFTYSLAKINI